MNSVADHYEGLLAEHYSWMCGVSPSAKAAEQLDLLKRLQVAAGELGVDLGAGSGFQSMAQGVDRFIPVRSTAEKIMTCFLEYHPDVVMVHDLIHIRLGRYPGGGMAARQKLLSEAAARSRVFWPHRRFDPP